MTGFTKQQPTIAGLYWWRPYRFKSLLLYRVWGRSAREMWCRRVDIDVLCDKEDVDEKGGDWYGPIILPYPADDTAPCVETGA